MNYFEACAYCMTHYGSTLASIHSSSDSSSVQQARVSNNIRSWIGANDLAIEGSFAWSDSTSYDYTLDWATLEPNNYNVQEDCVELYRNDSRNEYNDAPCRTTYNQFICNKAQNWRPIFKISSGMADYGGTSNVYEYWFNGTSNYDNYGDDYDFIYNGSFSASTADTVNNYRSLAIDDWTWFYDNNAFDKVKISLYDGGIETKYFVYGATSDKYSWMVNLHN